MSFAKFQEKQKQNKQKGVLYEFFTKRNGQFLCLSEDQTFMSLLRAMIKELAVKGADNIVTIPSPTKALKMISDSFSQKRTPALFIENVLSGTGETSFLIRQFRDAFPSLKNFLMISSADKGRIMLAYEAGVDNCLLKPISGVDLVEKASVTLKPPSAIRQLLDTARSLLTRNSDSEALKITQKVLQVKPDSASGYVVMGDALRRSGDDDKAQMAYERASRYNESYMEPLQKMADLAKEQGDAGRQLEYLKRLDALSPLNCQRKMEMAELKMSMGDMDAAKELFDTALSRTYKDAVRQVAAMSEKIATTLQDVDPVQAEKYLRKALALKEDDLGPDDLSTFNQLGISLRKQGRWLDAVKEYKRAFSLAPNSDVLHYNIAMAYAEGGDFKTANHMMLKAFSLNAALPNSSATIAYNMAQVFIKGYAQAKAVRCLEIALELRPDFAEARELLAQANEMNNAEPQQA